MEDLVRKRPFFLRNLSCTLSRHTVGDASHRILYTVANSNAMNGITPGTIITYTAAPWETALMAANIAIGIALIVGVAWVVIRVKKNRGT